MSSTSVSTRVVDLPLPEVEFLNAIYSLDDRQISCSLVPFKVRGGMTFVTRQLAELL